MGRWIRISVTLALFAALFLVLDLRSIASTVSSIDPALFLLSLAVIPPAYLIRAYKWRLILNDLGIGMGIAQSLSLTFTGVFYSLFTPGKVGELMRAQHMKASKPHAFASVAFDKATDIICLIFLSLLSLAVFSGHELFSVFILIVALFAAGIVALSRERVFMFAGRVLRMPKESAREFSGSFRRLFSNNVLMAKAMALSFIYYGICILFSILILKSIDVGIGEIASMSLPVIAILGNIPITVSGLGTREIISSLYFGSLGYPASYGFAFSILWFVAITLVPGIVGFAAAVSRRGKG